MAIALPASAPAAPLPVGAMRLADLDPAAAGVAREFGLLGGMAPAPRPWLPPLAGALFGDAAGDTDPDGVGPDRAAKCSIRGAIVAVCGPSGSGKTTLLRQWERLASCPRLPERERYATGASPVTLVANALRRRGLCAHEPQSAPRRQQPEAAADAPEDAADATQDAPAPVARAVRLLSRCGLAEALVLVRAARTLSAGERFRLGVALSLARGAQTLLIDEFGATLDRLTLAGVAANLRRLVDRDGLTLIAAGVDAERLESLAPDWWCWRGLAGAGTVTAGTRHPQPPATTIAAIASSSQAPSARTQARRARRTRLPAPRLLGARFAIGRGTREDWARFAPWHYRSARLGPTDRLFVLRAVRQCSSRATEPQATQGAPHPPAFGAREPLGIVVYGYPFLNVGWRNTATDGRFTPRRAPQTWAQRLNREVRVLTRAVLDPRVRGVGLAAWFVRQTVRRLGVPYVECLTAMGAYSGFLEAAGFVRHGRVPAPAEAIALIEWVVEQGGAPDTLRVAEAARRWYDACRPRVRTEFRKRLIAAIRRRDARRNRPRAASHFSRAALDRNWPALALELTRSIDTRPWYYLWHREPRRGGAERCPRPDRRAPR